MESHRFSDILSLENVEDNSSIKGIEEDIDIGHAEKLHQTAFAKNGTH